MLVPDDPTFAESLMPEEISRGMTVLEERMKLYYLTAILSVVFAVVGFSYNAWRLEASEHNNNVRTACFELLSDLAELEQIIYANHYDRNEVDGSPRKGWVRIGLIADLSALVSPGVAASAEQLKSMWSEVWPRVADDREVVDELVVAIDAVRTEIKHVLGNLE